MIMEIARKEFVCLIRDGRFKWAIGIMFLLLVTSFVTGYQRYESLHSIREASQQKNSEQWLNQDRKNPHTAAHFGNYAYKPQGPLAFFDNGITNYAGSVIWLEAHKTNFAQNRPAQDNGAVSRFGDLTPAMILQILLPLLIILMGFSAFAGERESGTLRQVMSLGVSSRALLLGKLLGTSAAIALIIVPVVAITTLVLGFGLPADSSHLGERGLLLLGFYLIYTLAFLLLTLGVSAISRTSKGALITLISFWAMATFILPKAAADISKMVVPTPTYSEFYHLARQTSLKGLEGAKGLLALPQGRHIEIERRNLLKKYNVKSVQDLPIYWVAYSMQIMEERDYSIYQKFLGDLRRIFFRQEAMQDRFGLVSPMISLRSLSMAVAGTGLVDQERFNQTAQDFRIGMIRAMNGELIENTTMKDPLYIGGKEVFSKVKPYQYSEPTLSESLEGQRMNIAILLAWAIVSAVFAFVAVNRLRVQ